MSTYPGDDDTVACWCGEVAPHYEPLPATCGGLGTIECECGGDNLCVCHNHGAVECSGCEECEDWDDAEGDDDGWTGEED